MAARVGHVRTAREHGDGHPAAVQAAAVGGGVDPERQPADHRARRPRRGPARGRRRPRRHTATGGGCPRPPPRARREELEQRVHPPAQNSAVGGSGSSRSGVGYAPEWRQTATTPASRQPPGARSAASKALDALAAAARRAARRPRRSARARRARAARARAPRRPSMPAIRGARCAIRLARRRQASQASSRSCRQLLPAVEPVAERLVDVGARCTRARPSRSAIVRATRSTRSWPRAAQMALSRAGEQPARPRRRPAARAGA